MVQNANFDLSLQTNLQRSLDLPLAVWRPSVVQTPLKTNGEWRNKVAPREFSFAVDMRYGPLLDLYLKCHSRSVRLRFD